MNPDNPIIAFSNLHKGLKRVKRGVTWKDNVAVYAANGLKNTYKLRQEHINGTNKLRPYQLFTITDPKRREVMATNIRDRQFQDSLCYNYFYDQITRGLIRDNFACQKGRGLDDALNRFEAHLHKFYRDHGADGFALKCDIHHYFAETEHVIAKRAVNKRVPDKDVQHEVAKIIDSFGDGKNIGLGSPVSQLIELVVLDELDHFIKERLHIKHYVRYMDDFILVHQSKEYLQYCLEEIRKFLAKIHLTLNAKTAIFPLSQGVIFLHWRFKLTESGKVIRLVSKETILHERRKLAHMKRRMDRGLITLQEAADSFFSWAGGVERKFTTNNTRRRVLGKRAYEGYNAKYVERMRDYFKELYGVDPYTLKEMTL